MNEKEAIENLKYLKENGLYQEIYSIDIETIETVLNLIEKQDKIIDLMANHIVTSDSDLCQYLDITTKCKYYAGENKRVCDECIKEYFTQKIEKGE